MHWQKMPEYFTEYFKYMYQRFVFFMQQLDVRASEHFSLMEDSLYELNFDPGKKIYRHR